MRHRTVHLRGAFVLLLVGLTFGLVFASGAVAVHDTPQFELEGNILDDPANPAPDWSTRFDASGNSLVGASCAFTADDLSTSTLTDRTVFLGSNKNGDPVPSWEWGTNNNPAKDDLANVYGCTTSNAAGDTVLYAGLERLAPNGASHIDYELFQSSVGLDHAVPCPADIECFFTGARTVGDIIISVDFENGGAVGSVTLRRWNGTDYVVVSSGGLGCNGADTICVFSNGTDIDGGPWPNFDEHGDVITTLPTNAFTEFGLNLTQLLGGAVPCTASAVLKTRSSPSFTSTLMDFAFLGLRTCPVKSGQKFHDLNGNGVKDAGEPGLPGWTIRAYKDTNSNGTLDAAEAAVAPAASAVTDASGNYTMTFPSGRYVVCEVLQAGWAQSFPTASGASCSAGAGLAPRGWAINLVGVVEDTGNDFGNYQQATKTGVKFEDLNANGVKDAGEPGLTGWGITAYVDVNGNGTKDAADTTVAATTTTGSGGTYTLSLAPGKYIVCETQQGGWIQSFPANTACGASAGGWGITLTSGQLDNNNDFGNYRNATKTGVKFEDLNANSVKDAGEGGLPGWTISAIVDTNGNGTLDAGENTVAASNVTDATGTYTLSLKPGKYIVCETQQNNWFQSWPANTLCGANAGGWAITLASGDVDSGNDFGNYRNATKSGQKFRDMNGDGVKDAGDPGVAGFVINAFLDANSNGILDPSETTIAGTATTNASGNYSINLRPGRYIVCEVQQTGWNQTFPANTVCAGKGGWGISLVSGQLDTGNDFGNVKVANANIQITPGTATNEVGSPHVFTGHVNVDAGDGFVNAPAGTLITFSVVSGPGTLTPTSCTTIGTTGSCTVTLNNGVPGVTVVNASTTVTVAGQTLTRSTGDGLTGDSPNATKTWVDANIQISPLTDTNAVGDPHVFTGHVNINTGTGGYVNAPAGTTINFTIVSGPGSLTPASCTTVGTTGSCTVTLNSALPGVTTVRASTDVVVGGLTLHRETGDGKAGDSANAVKTWVDANIQISPLTATNKLGDPHVFTGHVNINTGTGGYVNAPAGTTINFSIVSGPGSLTPTSCTTVGTTGSCTVTLNNPSTPGITTVNASTTVVVGGQTLTRSTGDGKAGDSANATKTWVDANIQISPLTATNALGQPHVFTGHVNINTGTGGYVNAPAGTTINFTILSGPGSLSAPSCTTVGTTGSCSVTLTNTTAAGVTTVRASTTVVVGGVSISRATGDANAGDSANGVKTWVEANIQISPPTATNKIGDPHVLTGHVNVNTGSGFTNAPAGTVINFSIVSGPGSLSAASCTTIGTTGSCTVTLNSSTPGVTTVHASSTLSVSGQTVTVQTNGIGANSGDAVKTWVDANIQISPLTATNQLGDPHVFTGHVNINTGTGGYVNAPAGTVINFTIVSGPGTLSAPSCTTVGTTGSCSVTLTNTTTSGQTTVRASTAVVVGGQTINRATGDANAGDSPNAVKTWIGALSGVKYNDLNGNGIRDAGEPGLPGWTIRAYADTNGNGTLDAGETTIAGSATTGADGSYMINGLSPGNYVVCEVLQPNWVQTAPLNTKCAAITGLAQGGYAVNLTGISQNLNFGNRVIGNLILTKTATPETLLVGQNITYTITVHNAGAFPATQVVMTDPLPTSQVSFVSASSTQGTCTGTGPVTCNIGTMAPDATVTITIVVKANVVGTVENPAHVSGFELETTLIDNDDSATVTVTAPFVPPATCGSLRLSRTRVTVGRRFVVTATLRDTKRHLMAGKLIRVRGAGVWVNARTNAKGVANIAVRARSEGTVRFTAVTGTARCSASVRANAPFLPPLTGRYFIN